MTINLIKLNSNVFDEACSYCGYSMKSNDYYFYGWRALYDCTCEKCNAHFLMDMPIFSGIPYPAIYDKDQKTVINDVPAWWGGALENGLLKISSERVISEIKVDKKNNKLIIFNLFDPVFGHSFMRLEHLTHYVRNKDFNNYDLLVLIPFQLRYLIKKFECTVSIIEVKIPFSSYRNFYETIDKNVKCITQNYSSVYIEMLKYPQQEFLNLDMLNLPINKWPKSIGKVVIVYRKDRTIGFSKRMQYLFYCNLIKLIHDLDVDVFMIGDSDVYEFPGVKDLRAANFTVNTDELWNQTCCGAIVVGVHGSHMLIPSLCSAYTIEFVSYGKLYNFGQASAFLNTLNQQETVQKYRYVYGNGHLSNIDPGLVFEIIKSIVIVMNNIFNAVYKEKFSSLGEVRLSYKKNKVGALQSERGCFKKIAEMFNKIRRKGNF